MLTVMITLSDHFSLLVSNLSGLSTTSVRRPILTPSSNYYSNYISVFLFTGQLVSDCLLPCVRTSADVQELTTSNFNGSSVLGLSFNNKVRVRKTTMDRFSFMDSLNFFGSNLGLWPGLGLYQILEWITGMFLASTVFKAATKIFPLWKRT